MCAVCEHECPLLSSQVYPTATRALGLGTCSGVARVGALITPFIAQVNVQHAHSQNCGMKMWQVGKCYCLSKWTLSMLASWPVRQHHHLFSFLLPGDAGVLSLPDLDCLQRVLPPGCSGLLLAAHRDERPRLAGVHAQGMGAGDVWTRSPSITLWISGLTRLSCPTTRDKQNISSLPPKQECLICVLDFARTHHNPLVPGKESDPESVCVPCM